MGIFLTQGLNLGLLHCMQILYHLSHQGSHTEWSRTPLMSSESRNSASDHVNKPTSLLAYGLLQVWRSQQQSVLNPQTWVSGPFPSATPYPSLPFWFPLMFFLHNNHRPMGPREHQPSSQFCLQTHFKKGNFLQVQNNLEKKKKSRLGILMW